jgi:hypothetical protein
MKRIIYFIVVTGIFLLTTAFDCNPPPPPPPPNGFTIHTQFQEVINGVPLAPVNHSVSVSAEFLTGTTMTSGTLTRCFGTTDGNGLLPCPDRMVPGAYSLSEFSGPCIGRTIISDIIPAGGTLGAVCRLIITRFSISPESINVQASPPTIEMWGEGMTGAPVIRIVDVFGQVVATTTATQCNGSWLAAPCPYLNFVYTGDYAALVYNVAPDGSLERIGGEWLYVYGNDPPPPPPPGDGCGYEYQDPRIEQMPCLEY